jgi:hypothetical protein
MFKAILTFDTDAVNQNNRNLEFNRMDFDFDQQLCEVLCFLADHNAKATAFVRVDQQLDKYFGYLHLFEKVLSAIDKSGRPEVEIGWHPHIYSRRGDKYEVAREDAFVAEMIEEVYSSVEEVHKMRCVRLGGNQGGDLIISTLDRLGFAIDSSAFPGRKQVDAHRHFDWSRCTNSPYHPSIDDYQRGDSVNHAILEIPITTIPFETPYDHSRKPRAVHPCFRNELFEKAIVENQHLLKKLGFCVLLFHPDELIDGYTDDLYFNGFGNFRRNFECFCRVMGEVEFVTLSEFRKTFTKTSRPGVAGA